MQMNEQQNVLKKMSGSLEKWSKYAIYFYKICFENHDIVKLLAPLWRWHLHSLD